MLPKKRFFIFYQIRKKFYEIVKSFQITYRYSSIIKEQMNLLKRRLELNM